MKIISVKEFVYFLLSATEYNYGRECVMHSIIEQTQIKGCFPSVVEERLEMKLSDAFTNRE